MLDEQLKTQLAAYLERVQQPFELVTSLDDSETARDMRERVHLLETRMPEGPASPLLTALVQGLLPERWCRGVTATGMVLVLELLGPVVTQRALMAARETHVSQET